jgi:hypothetical protein
MKCQEGEGCEYSPSMLSSRDNIYSQNTSLLKLLIPKYESAQVQKSIDTGKEAMQHQPCERNSSEPHECHSKRCTSCCE